jgi:hypothetical protein
MQERDGGPPPLLWGFEDTLAPPALDALPPLNLGFQEVDAPPFPLPPHEANPLLPLYLGFQEASPAYSLPPLNLGSDDHVMQERDASLPPLVWGFEGDAASC